MQNHSHATDRMDGVFGWPFTAPDAFKKTQLLPAWRKAGSSQRHGASPLVVLVTETASREKCVEGYVWLILAVCGAAVLGGSFVM